MLIYTMAINYLFKQRNSKDADAILFIDEISVR